MVMNCSGVATSCESHAEVNAGCEYPTVQVSFFRFLFERRRLFKKKLK